MPRPAAYGWKRFDRGLPGGSQRLVLPVDAVAVRRVLGTVYGVAGQWAEGELKGWSFDPATRELRVSVIIPGTAVKVEYHPAARSAPDIPPPASYPVKDATGAEPLDPYLPDAHGGDRYGGLSGGRHYLWDALAWRKRILWGTGEDPGNRAEAWARMTPKEQTFHKQDQAHADSWFQNYGAEIAIGLSLIGAGAALAGNLAAAGASAAVAPGSGVVGGAAVETTAPSLASLAGSGAMVGAGSAAEVAGGAVATAAAGAAAGGGSIASVVGGLGTVAGVVSKGKAILSALGKGAEAAPAAPPPAAAPAVEPRLLVLAALAAALLLL